MTAFLLLFVIMIRLIIPESAAVSHVSASQTFRRYLHKRISSQTTLTSFTLPAKIDSLCVFQCLKRGSACFAAQYEASSYTCLLQLNCGVVLLENDNTGKTSVYVPGELS